MVFHPTNVSRTLPLLVNSKYVTVDYLSILVECSMFYNSLVNHQLNGVKLVREFGYVLAFYSFRKHHLNLMMMVGEVSTSLVAKLLYIKKHRS